ncbi:unnamed protein product, partial [Heterobilharzia americana]
TKNANENQCFEVVNPFKIFMEIKKHHGILKPCVLKLYKFSNITILPLSKHEFICK